MVEVGYNIVGVVQCAVAAAIPGMTPVASPIVNMRPTVTKMPRPNAQQRYAGQSVNRAGLVS